MKKFISIMLCLILAASLFTGCSEASDNKKLNIVTTIFPVYDWVREILGEEGENAELTLLLDNGVDLHSYQPTADNIVKIASCDIFIYVGGHSDEWVSDVLAQATNKDMVVINLFEVLGDAVKEEEIVEGMEHEKSEEHAHEDEDDHDEVHVHEEDEHIWLSLRNAKVACKEIAEKLCVINPENEESYRGNVKEYCAKLDTLDKEYQNAVNKAPTKTLLFGDRFSFRYLTDDYGITYYAAFTGCSAESEASFETVAFLAGKMDELKLKNIMIIEGSDGSIAKTINDTTTAKNAKVLTLNSMQTTTSSDVNNGTTYLSIMESNLAVLTEALN